jgi:hypothetical protein
LLPWVIKKLDLSLKQLQCLKRNTNHQSCTVWKGLMLLVWAVKMIFSLDLKIQVALMIRIKATLAILMILLMTWFRIKKTFANKKRKQCFYIELQMPLK